MSDHAAIAQGASAGRSSSKTFMVAWREFKATALTKAFILAAVLVPVLIIALGILGPLLFNPKPPPLTGTVAVVDPGGALARAARIEFEPERIRERIGRWDRGSIDGPGDMRDASQVMDVAGNVVTQPFDIALTLDESHDPSQLESLKAQVRDGSLVAVITTVAEPESTRPAQTAPTTVPSATQPVASSSPRLFVPSNMNMKHTSLLEDLVQASTSRARIEQAGMDVQTVRDLARAPDPMTIRISKEGAEKQEGEGTKIFKMMTPMAFMMLLWIGAFVSANYLLTTTIEEKSNKVMEVLLSAVSPMQLMTGKIIGQALVGLVMSGMYLAMGMAALTLAAYADLVEWHDLAYFGLFYVMAYFMIASIFAAIGSAVNELREAQSLMTPAMLLLMVPLMLWLPISDSPNGTLATVTSFIPPLIPFVMILRVTGSEPIAAWQIVASIIVGFASMFAMMWMAAKVFRVGVLMYGKPPSPLELIRWVRYR